MKDGEVLIKAAEDELERLLQEKAEIDRQSLECQRKLTAVQKTMDMLLFAYNPPAQHELEAVLSANPGITEQVRGVLKNGYPALYPATSIRDHIEQFGGKPLKTIYKNPMAVIHQVLRRLEEQGEVECKPGLVTGEKAYGWKEAPTRNYVAEYLGTYQHPAYNPALVDPMTAPPTPGRMNTLADPSLQGRYVKNLEKGNNQTPDEPIGPHTVGGRFPIREGKK